jgi:hypothetical protein
MVDDRDRVKTKLVHTDKIILGGDMILENGGRILTSGGGDISFDPEGNGQVFINGEQVGPVEWLDEDVSQGTANRVNVVGAGAVVTVVGGEATLNVGGASGVLEIQKDSVKIDDASILNYLRKGVQVGVGGGIATIDFPQEADNFLEVHPGFTDNAGFGQYSTIRAAITRAKALFTGGAYMTAIKVRANDTGPYVETNLDVSSGISLEFDNGADLQNVNSPVNPAVVMSGNGRIKNARVAPGTGHGAQPLMLIKDGFAGIVTEWFSAIALVPVSVKAHIEFEDSAASPLCVFKDCSCIDVANNDVIIGSGDWSIFSDNFQLIALFGASQNMFTWVNGSLGSPKTVFYVQNGGILYIAGGDTFNLGSNVRFDTQGSFFPTQTVTAPTGLDQIRMTDAQDMQQTVLPLSGLSKGTVETALIDLDAARDVAIQEREDLRNNVGILSSAMPLEQGVILGDFDGIVQESFANDDNIPTLAGFELETQLAKAKELATLDDFEGYADSAALQAVWVASDATNTQATLVTAGGYLDNGKYMRIDLTSNLSSGDTVTRTYGTPQDWTLFDRIFMAIAGEDDSGNAPLRLVLEDSQAAQAVWPYKFYPASDWVLRTFLLSEATVPTGFRWWEISKIIFEVGTVGAGNTGGWHIDLMQLETTGEFNGRATLDAMDALTNWTLSGGGSALQLGASNPREGTGYLYFTVGGGIGFGLKRTWPGGGTYANLVSTDELIRIHYRAESVVGAGSYGSGMLMTLKDESGNSVLLFPTTVKTRPFASTDLDWQPYEFFIWEGTFTEPSPPFDITKIVEIEISNNGGGSGTWDIAFDWLEVGGGAYLESDLFDLGEDYNQVKLFPPFSGYQQGKTPPGRGDEEDFRVQVSSTGDFDIDDFRAGKIVNCFPYSTGSPYPNSQFKEWNDLVEATIKQKLKYRIVARRRTQVSGISIMYRKV